MTKRSLAGFLLSIALLFAFAVSIPDAKAGPSPTLKTELSISLTAPDGVYVAPVATDGIVYAVLNIPTSAEAKVDYQVMDVEPVFRSQYRRQAGITSNINSNYVQEITRWNMKDTGTSLIKPPGRRGL